MSLHTEDSDDQKIDPVVETGEDFQPDYENEYYENDEQDPFLESEEEIKKPVQNDPMTVAIHAVFSQMATDFNRRVASSQLIESWRYKFEKSGIPTHRIRECYDRVILAGGQKYPGIGRGFPPTIAEMMTEWNLMKKESTVESFSDNVMREIGNRSATAEDSRDLEIQDTLNFIEQSEKTRAARTIPEIEQFILQDDDGKAPRSLRAEHSLLAVMLNDRDSMLSALEKVRDDDLYYRDNRIIFQVIRERIDKHQPVESAEVWFHIQSDPSKFGDSVTGKYIEEINAACPSPRDDFKLIDYADNYIEKILEHSAARQALALSQKVKESIENHEPISEVISDLQQKSMAVGARSQSKGFSTLGQMSKNFLTTIRQRSKMTGEIVGTPTGFTGFDRITSGLQSEDFMVLAARPGHGKTAAVNCIAHHLAVEKRVPVAYFSQEMPEYQFMERFNAISSKVNTRIIRRGKFTPEEFKRINHAVRNEYNAPLYLDDTPGAYLEDITSKASRLQAELADQGGLGLIVVDYLQLTQVRKRTNRQQDISDIAVGFKNLARRLKCPLIALSQLSRKVDEREDKRPILSDLRESGSIEQEADIVAFLYHPSKYKNLSPEEAKYDPEANMTEFIIGKNRHGSTGTVILKWEAEYTRFTDYDDSQVEDDLMGFANDPDM